MIVTDAGVHPNVSTLVDVAARAPDTGYTALAKNFPNLGRVVFLPTGDTARTRRARMSLSDRLLRQPKPPLENPPGTSR
jgi:hypothetical protein